MSGEAAHAVGDVADDLNLRKVDLIDVRAIEIDMDHLWAAVPHDERGLLHGVVADRDDQVGAVDGVMDIVALGQAAVPI